jgi:ribosome biogenesis GTPase
VERYLAMAWESGASPVVVLSKADLSERSAELRQQVEKMALGATVLVSSNVTGEGVEVVAEHLGPGVTAVLLGSSGVGKSTLVNRLLGEERQRVADIRGDGRGRHTTTHRELMALPSGGLIIDTPGLRELQLWAGEEGHERAFADIAEIAARCRFTDCGHQGEPGCAVERAVEEGTLPAGRLDSYRKLEAELSHLETRTDYRARAEERKRWRTIARPTRQLGKQPGAKP